MGEKDRQNGLWLVERERSEEAKVLMNGLMSPSCHTRDLLASWPELLPRAMPVSETQLLLWSMFM